MKINCSKFAYVSLYIIIIQVFLNTTPKIDILRNVFVNTKLKTNSISLCLFFFILATLSGDANIRSNEI